MLNARKSLRRIDLDAVVAQVHAHGTGQVFLTGGEPLLRFEELAALGAAAAAGADVWVMTSGQRLTDERAQRLRAAGFTGVMFSLDDWRADQHDRFRGVRGAYAGVERGAAAARLAGPLIAVSLCPTRAFVTEDNLNRYADRLRASLIQILEPKALGLYAGQAVDRRPRTQDFHPRLTGLLARSRRLRFAVGVTARSVGAVGS